MRFARTLTLAVAAGLLVSLAAAPAAPAHRLSLTRAKSAATAKARSLAKRREGETSNARYSRPRCARKSVHRFICSTTISGLAPCSPAEVECDGGAPFAIGYRITVVYRTARSTRLLLITRQA